MAGDHFYTTSITERDNAVAKDGYNGEGVACYVYDPQQAGTAAFYRLFSPGSGDHFYTTSTTERDNAVAKDGYNSEGVACYVYDTLPSGPDGSAAFWRLFNPSSGDHFYTTSPPNATAPSPTTATATRASQATGTKLSRLARPRFTGCSAQEAVTTSTPPQPPNATTP